MDSRVRIVDIANDLAVSVSTVSKALAGSREISPATIARVREHAKSLGYRPNGAARRLRAGKARTIGLLTHDSIGWQSLPVLLGAEDAFGAEQLSVLLSDSRGDPIRKKHHIRTLLEHGIDGIIALGRDTNDQPSLGNIGVPVVYAYGASADPNDFSLVPDEGDGARIAAEFLVNLGRRKIGHITGPSHYAAVQRRAAAAEQVLEANGLVIAGSAPLLGDWTEQWGRVAVEMLLRREPELDAVFCGNDTIARGVLEALTRLGRKVPSDIAVIGYDNWAVIAAGAHPALTSIDLNLDALGRAAAAALVDMINGKKLSGVEHLPCSLVVRDSTG